MDTTRRLLPLVLAVAIAGSAAAQEAPDPVVSSPAEFSRGSGGQIETMTKPATKKLSGSLGVRMSQSSFSGQRPGYEATLGGTIVQDRLWFFAAASAFPQIGIGSQAPGDSTLDTKIIAQVGSRNNLVASFSEARHTATALNATGDLSLPSSFLSLRYTGVISNNLFFNASFLQYSGTAHPLFPAEPR